MTAAPPTSNYGKYQTGNPVMRWVIARFLDRVVALVGAQEPRTVVDLGCGEGMVARRLSGDIDYLGLELNPVAVEVARREVPAMRFEVADIVRRAPERDWADVALCLEVLEHLDDPEPAVARIAEWTRGVAIVSVPWEPFFRGGNFLRGKYVARLGNHPEHVQQFGPRALSRLLERHFRVVRIETCFPWLIAVAAGTRES
ncbi:MAG: class I SAM-dependent methyltransferase [Myxococcota bacterium]|nr:class I SAM-dependent methyltransferase [Myxococcota bacterium]